MQNTFVGVGKITFEIEGLQLQVSDCQLPDIISP